MVYVHSLALIIEVVEAGLQVVIVSEVAWDHEFRGLVSSLVLLPLMVGQLFRLQRETMAKEALHLGIVGVVVGRLDQLRVLPLELEVVELVWEAAVRVVQGDRRLVGSGHGSALFKVEVPVFFVKFRARVAVDWLKAGRLVGRSVWNTEWVLIIPGQTLLANPNAGLDKFIDEISDIKLLFQTYSYSGN